MTVVLYMCIWIDCVEGNAKVEKESIGRCRILTKVPDAFKVSIHWTLSETRADWRYAV